MVTDVNTEIQVLSKNRFLIKRSQLTTLKLFVEFYLPEYQDLLAQLRQSPYPLKQLQEISKRLYGGPFGSDRKVDMYRDTGIPYLRVKDVLPEGIEQDGLTYISSEKHNELARSRVLPGHVLLTTAGRLGTAAVFPEELGEGNITGHIVGIEPHEDINPHYLALFLNSRFGEFQAKRWGHRTTRPELNLLEVGQILVTVPPRPVQDRIAEIMQEAYATRQAKLAQAQELLGGIDNFVLGRLGIQLETLADKKHFTVSISRLKGNRFDIGPYANEFDAMRSTNGTWVSLREVAHLSHQARIASNTPDAEFIYVGMSDVSDRTAEVRLQRLLGGQIRANKTVFKGNDVVFARIEPCIYNRKIALIPAEVEEALGSTELLVAQARKGVILPEF
ncbi:MAG: restriction endonuclease subunit S, partial [Chloroflexota bacterium]